MPMRPTDPIIGQSRATAAEAIAFAERVGSTRLADVRTFLVELERLCALVGFDFAILAAQSALETDNWRDERWQGGLNPAGIGATDGPDLSQPYRDGTEAAKAQIIHMIAYVYGAEAPQPARELVGQWRHLDPRYLAVFTRGWAGTARQLADLSGKWASVEDYAERICARALAMWPQLPDSPAGGEPMGKPYVLVVAGHRMTGPGGSDANPREREMTDEMAESYVAALRAAGLRADWFQRDVDKDTLPRDTAGDLDDVALGCNAWLARQPEPDLIMVDCHYNGAHSPLHVIVPDNRGLRTGYPGGAPADDTATNNTLDVKLAAAIAEEMAKDGLGTLFRGKLGVPGVMSETETGVGRQGYRLAMFAATVPVRSRCVRIIVEHGGTDDPAAKRNDFTERCAAAFVRAVVKVYGLDAAPKPRPEPNPETVPEPRYPEGMDAGIAEWLFGRIERGGKLYAFNPRGPVSRAWLRYGARYGYTQLVDVWRFSDGREYFRFATFTLWRPNAREEFRPLERGSEASA